MVNREVVNKCETSLVLAGGGVAGLGHIAGKLQAIKDYAAPNPEVFDVPILGTSAGSIAGGFAVAGVKFEDLANTKQFGWPESLRYGFLEGLLTDIYAGALDIPREKAKEIKAPNIDATVFSIASLRRRLGLMRINGGTVPLPKLGAASSAVPPVFSPVRIGTELCVDGGVGGSASHIALGRPAQNTIVVAPMAEHFMPPVGGLFENMLQREIDHRQQKYGGNVVYLRPNRKVGAAVTHLPDMFNVDKGRKIYELSYGQMRGILDRYVGDEGKVGLGDIAVRLAAHHEFTTPAFYGGKHAA